MNRKSQNPSESSQNPKNAEFMKTQVKPIERVYEGTKRREQSQKRLEENKNANAQKRDKDKNTK